MEVNKKILKEITWQVEYDFTGSILHVTIVKCEDLAAMDIGGTSDPYVKVYLLPDRKRKQVQYMCVLQLHKETVSLRSWFMASVAGNEGAPQNPQPCIQRDVQV